MCMCVCVCVCVCVQMNILHDDLVPFMAMEWQVYYMMQSILGARLSQFPALLRCQYLETRRQLVEWFRSNLPTRATKWFVKI